MAEENRYAFDREPDIDRVLRLSRQPQSLLTSSVLYPRKTYPALRSYVAEASRDGGITAAFSQSADASIPECLGTGYVYLMHRNEKTDCLDYILDEEGNKVEIKIWNYLKTAFCKGARFHVLQDLPNGDFYILHSKELSLLEGVTCFYPGGTDTWFKLLSFQNGAWQASGIQVKANDPQGRNCVLPGERIWAFPRGNCDGVPQYDLVGENGLTRIAIANQNIECNASGDVTIWTHPSQTCAQAATECTLNVCNNWGAVHCVLAGERIRIRFFEAKWQIAPEPVNLFYRAALASNLCTDDASAAIDPESLTPLDYCLAENPALALDENGMATVSNSYSLAGCAGDTVLVKRNGTSCDDATYELVQVTHHAQRVAVGFRYNSCKLEMRSVRIAGLAECCDTPIWGCLPTSLQEDDSNNWCIQMYSHTIVQNVSKVDTTSGSSGGDCRLTKQRETVCLFEQQGTPTAENVITFEAQTILATVRQKDGENCLEGYIVTAYVACLEGGEYVDLVCGTDCGS